MALRPVDAKLLSTRGDPLDRRLGDFARTVNDIATLKIDDFAIVGYPDDEGIRLNGGRPGSAQAPDKIRSYLYKMTPPAFLNASKTAIHISDLGNLLSEEKIEERHKAARSIARSVHLKKTKIISFGGGHDYGFSDAAAYCETAFERGEKPLVINFDAHLDVRPLDRGFTSGTPFFRLIEEFPRIDFVEIGLQSQCNSKSHVDWLISRGGLVSFEEERMVSGFTLTQTLQKLLGLGAQQGRSAFLSVDIDGFSSSIAPGASQSWPTGFGTRDFFECFSWCLNRFDVRGTGVYEVSPPLDIDDRTSRLAALIAHRFVFQF